MDITTVVDRVLSALGATTAAAVVRGRGGLVTAAGCASTHRPPRQIVRPCLSTNVVVHPHYLPDLDAGHSGPALSDYLSGSDIGEPGQMVDITHHRPSLSASRDVALDFYCAKNAIEFACHDGILAVARLIPVGQFRQGMV
jgi:hypothetical protein